MHEARQLLHGRTTVLNTDFAQVIPLAEATSLMYLDPPYYKAGNQLYNFPWTDEDHVRLRDALRGKSNWVLSYDDHSRIRELYSVLARPVPVTYSIGKTKKTELLLFRRLEFKPDFNPEVGVTDMLRIWVDPNCPRCGAEMDVRPCLVCGYPNDKN